LIRSNYSLIRDHKYRSLAVSKLFGHLSYGNADAIMNAIGYAEFYSRSHHAVVRVYDDAGNVIETHEHKGEFQRFDKCSAALLIAAIVGAAVQL
jgi:hypothetical protein